MNTQPIISIKIQSTADVVLARQRAQAIAEMARFDTLRQTSFATALSEIARNALQFARGGRVSFSVEAHGPTRYLTAQVVDDGPGIQELRDCGGRWDRNVELPGHGITSARKLVKLFSIECPASGGTGVKLGIPFPEELPPHNEEIQSWGSRLSQRRPLTLLEEMHLRNQELLTTLEALQRKEMQIEKQMAQDAILKAELAESRELLEKRVRERTDSLTISNQELRAFSYTVSHDLRAPLRAINGFIQLLLDEHVRSDDPPAAELARNVLQATSRMDALIQDLVAYTQVNKASMVLKPVDCAGLIAELLKQYAPRLGPERARIERSGTFPMIMANPAILQSAVNNLMENALKFRKPGGEAAINLRGAPNGTNFRLWVEDEGIGIAPVHHERIFQVFERLHGREIPGTGIGLALVKRWIAGMQGSVGVESDVNAGARFWVELPLA
jgi:signal transduction histidine kinase